MNADKNTNRESSVDEVMSMLVWVGNGLIGLAAWALVYTGLPAEPAAILSGFMCVDFVLGISAPMRSVSRSLAIG